MPPFWPIITVEPSKNQLPEYFFKNRKKNVLPIAQYVLLYIMKPYTAPQVVPRRILTGDTDYDNVT
jgi:hypothetical protein